MNVRPIRDMVWLQPEPLEETSKGGILIPRTAKAKHMIGKVLATGPGRVTDHGHLIEPSVRVGDRVLVREYTMAQTVARVDSDDKTVLVPEMDIDGVLE